jgi:methylase of polypeptide subunit release factors
MSEHYDEIASYSRDLHQANVEQAKKERFKSLLERLFGSDEKARQLIDGMSLGAEQVVFNIPLPERVKTGFADTQYGNVIIEFESDLDATGEHAKDQLREYVAGNFESGETTSYTLISTDGLQWEVYTPDPDSLAEGDLSAPDVILNEMETLVLPEDPSEDEAEAFYYFLDRRLFHVERLKPTLEHFQREFGPASATFSACMTRLTEHFHQTHEDGEVETAYTQWERFLSIAYGSFESSARVFLVHTYLSVFAKMLAYVVVAQTDHIGEDELRGIVRGGAFEKLNVRNFTGRDFFGWVGSDAHFDALKPVFRRLAQAIGDYDFRRVEEDILKGVYQELIDRDTRHDLGEYYTPDWLCKHIVEELDPEADARILDPACGSGSFLRAAAMRLRTEHPERSAQEIAQQITGIDIHPLSVQIAKTTLLLALGEKIKNVKRPVTLRVYLANTLLSPKGSVGLFGSSFTLTIDEQPYKINSKVFDDPGFFDAATDACEELAELTKGEEVVSQETFRNALEKRDLSNGLSDDLVQSFHRIYQGFKGAKEAGRDSIWRFIVQNSYKPYFMRDQFDYVVGNPPWISYRYVENESYQDRLRRLAEKLKVMPESKENLTHLEIASIFFAHAADYFLKRQGEVAFVLPRSLFSAAQHRKVRGGTAEGLKLTEVWDLDDVEPLFKVPSCVLFAEHRVVKKKIPNEGLPGRVFSGRLTATNLNWTEAAPDLTEEETRYYHGKLGSLTALTRYKLQSGGKVNHYQPHFRQGATIVPRNFYFVEPASDPPDLTNRVITVQPDAEQLKHAKKPWKHFERQGRIHTRFLFRTALAKNLVPFALVDPVLVLLPAEAQGRSIKLYTPDDLMQDGHLDAAKWFTEAAEYWREHCTERNEDTSLTEYLNWRSKLTKQDLGKDYLVLYTASAKDANAAVVRRDALDRTFVVDYKAYWYGTNDLDEAHYVAAFLNADEPNRMIKAFQSRGNFGPRDVSKKILEVPLPEYDASSERHQRLASLGRQAKKRTADFLAVQDLSGLGGRKLGSLRLEVREHLEETLEGIDAVLEEMVT